MTILCTSPNKDQRMVLNADGTLVDEIFTEDRYWQAVEVTLCPQYFADWLRKWAEAEQKMVAALKETT